MSESFYVVLVSNVVTDIFKNTPNHFTTPLAVPISLVDEAYEVGLAAISYCHSFYNIIWPLNVVTLNKLDLEAKNTDTFMYDMSNGYYPTAKTFCDQYDKERPEGYNSKCEFDKLNEKIKIIVPEWESVQFNPELARMLGFKSKDGVFPWFKGRKRKGKFVFKARYVADMSPSMSSLYIYSDIVRDMRVGNSFASLLTTVGIRGKHGETIHEIFTEPQYVPVRGTDIKNIEIMITDDAGRDVVFRKGRVMIKLHFRKKRQVY